MATTYRERRRAVGLWAVLAGCVMLAGCGSATATTAPAANPTIAATVEKQVTQGGATATPLSPTTAPALATATVIAAATTAAPTQAAATATVAAATHAPTSAAALVDTLLQVPDQWRTGVFADPHHLNVLPGYHISVFASGLGAPRLMAYGPDGNLYVTVTDGGKVLRLPDSNHDGVADSVQTFAEGLDGPHGIAFHDGWWYIAEHTKVVRLKDVSGGGRADQSETVIADLPHGGGHSTRTLVFGPDGKIYVAAGSSCNVCEEDDSRRAAISVYDADGKNQRVYASGLRNAVGLTWQPGTNALYADVNNRDNIGDDIPPETVDVATDGANFGWPYCYGDQVWDKDFGKRDPAFCKTTKTPAVLMQAHSAPLGLRFYDATQFPQMQGDLFMGFHGSWNRTTPTGYKVVYVPFDPATRQPVAHIGTKDFVSGWLPADAKGDTAWGRPVDVIVAPDGALLISDDRAGAIYRVTYGG